MSTAFESFLKKNVKMLIVMGFVMLLLFVRFNYLKRFSNLKV